MTDQATERVEPVEGILVPTISATAAREMFAASYNPDRDFIQLVQDSAFKLDTFRLAEKEELEGVPHVVLGITFRKGYPRAGVEGDYVSIEAVVAPTEILNDPVIAKHIPNLSVYGNEAVVYNDSGTGIRRHLTMLCERANLINVGKVHDNENPYDRQYQLWESGAEAAQDGFNAKEHFGRGSIVPAVRGLRKSEYESPYGPATTWYFG